MLLRTLFPGPAEDGVFACGQQALLTWAVQHTDTRPAAARGPGPLRLAAQRHEQLVVVYFTPLPVEAAPLANAGRCPRPKLTHSTSKKWPASLWRSPLPLPSFGGRSILSSLPTTCT
ncbi:MAG: hypothetical protein EOO59_14330 [Hymenobacter sp.]|nr:MAG: hypothetical protein EOO59_14330 [Hymenobacter sp.]